MKRAVQDINYYDPPASIWRKINGAPYPYRVDTIRMQLRDLALMSALYLSCTRITEMVGGPVACGVLPGITVGQFDTTDPDFLSLRSIKNIKHKYTRRAGAWVPIDNPSLYPTRNEVKMPRRGSFAPFTRALSDYLEMISSHPTTQLFTFTPRRARQIMDHASGLWPHYLRDQGFRAWYRVFKLDAFKLKQFSGHKKWDSLEKYMYELTDDDFKAALEF